MRHLMSPLDFTVEELDKLLDLANDIEAHPDKYEAIPHIPRYADKDGYKPLIFTNQICKLRKDKHGWYVKFPKAVLQAQGVYVIDMILVRWICMNRS